MTKQRKYLSGVIKSFIALIGILLFSKAQMHAQNLYPDPSFEHYISIPTSPYGTFLDSFVLYDINNPCSVRDEPISYYSTLDSRCAPNTAYGFQMPRSGNGMMLITPISVDGVAFHIEENELTYIQAKLIHPLLAGHRYEVQFFVNVANETYAPISYMGAYFSDSAIVGSTVGVGGCTAFTMTPQIENDSANYLTDSAGWMPICGSFIAAGGEQYMTIGNFHTVLSTPLLSLPLLDDAFYFVDDVSVYDSTAITDTARICASDSLLVGSTWVHHTGFYSDTNSCGFVYSQYVIVDTSTASVTSIDTSICVGDSVRIGNYLYFSSGTFTSRLTNYLGCDSLITLNLTVTGAVPYAQFLTICPGDSILYGGIYYREGYYHLSLPTSLGCDSLVSLSVTSGSFSFLNIRACLSDTFFFNGHAYTTAGFYSDTLTSWQGCDSVVEFLLNDIPPTEVFRYICMGDSTNFRGVTYSTVGDYTITVTTSSSCDSIFHLHVNYQPFVHTDYTYNICRYDTILVGTHRYTNSGTYYDTLRGVNNCDSAITTHIVQRYFVGSVTVVYVCNGHSFFDGHRTFTRTGFYRDTILTAAGCDSVVFYNVVVRPAISSTRTYSICRADSVVIGTHVHRLAGVYTDTLISYTGCDSVVHATVNIIAARTHTINRNLCSGDTLRVGSSMYTGFGTFYDTIRIAGGCDSIITTNITILRTTSATFNDTICAGDTAYIGRSTFSNPGTFVDHYFNAAGCDSAVTINIFIRPADSTYQSFNICPGASVRVATHTYNSAGLYHDTLSNHFGCDSVIHSLLNITALIRDTQSVQFCPGGSIRVAAHVYTATGNYLDTIPSFSGCDSIILTRVVVNSNSRFSQNITRCAGDSVLVGGSIYTTNGTFYDTLSNSLGCDSIITSTLRFNSPSASSSHFICNSDSFFVGGSWQHSAGIFHDTLVGFLGCDSVLTTTLFVGRADTISQDKNVCQGQSYFCGGSNQTLSGTYTDHYTNSSGCDSQFITHLMVHNYPALSVSGAVSACYNSYANLSASGIGPFAWSTGDTGATLHLHVSSSGYYFVTEIDSHHCNVSDSILVNVWPLPLIQTSDTVVCSTEPVAPWAAGGTSYHWADGSRTAQIFVNANGNRSYVVTVTDANGCIDSAYAHVRVANPFVQIKVSPGKIVTIGDEVTLHAMLSAGDDSIIAWMPAESFTEQHAATTNFFPENSGWYFIEIRNPYGCTAFDSIYIEVLPLDNLLVPTAFSPNGDGLNDVFHVNLSPRLSLESFNIFNRWGEQVYSYPDDGNQGWDGMFKGREQAMAVYVWTATARNIITGKKIIRTGQVTLLR
jgi:gliding motility-associated-like protein